MQHRWERLRTIMAISTRLQLQVSLSSPSEHALVGISGALSVISPQSPSKIEAVSHSIARHCMAWYGMAQHGVA